jgi:hypothetical protein
VQGLSRAARLLVWLMVAAGAGWAEFLAARVIRNTSPETTSGTAQRWVYLLVELTTVAAALTLAWAATSPGARTSRLTLVIIGVVGVSLAAEVLPATREALVTAFTLWPLPGSEPQLFTAQALLGSGLTWLGLTCGASLCVVSPARPTLAVTLAGGAYVLPIGGRIVLPPTVPGSATLDLGMLVGVTAAVVAWLVLMEIRIATRAGSGLGRLLGTTPIVLLLVLAAKLAWLWAGYRQSLPRAFGGGAEHWAAARVDGPVAWLVGFLVAATAVFLLARVQQANLRVSEQAAMKLALVAAAVLVLPSLLYLTLGLVDTVVTGLRPARGLELVPLAAALVLASWFAHIRRSRAAIIVAALVGCCAMVAASALLLGPAPNIQPDLGQPLSMLPTDPRWVRVVGLGLTAVVAVFGLAGLRLGWAEFARSAPGSGPFNLAAAPLDAQVNVLAVVGFFSAAGTLAGMAWLALMSPGLVRQPVRVVWDLLIDAVPEPVTLDAALTVTAAIVVVACVLRRRVGLPAVLTGLVVGSTLLVHALPFGLRALLDTPRLLLLGPALAFAYLFLFDAASLNRDGPSRQWRILTVSATLVFLLALVGLWVAERRVQSLALLVLDDSYQRLLGGVGGVDVLRLLLGLPLLVVFTAAGAGNAHQTLASECWSQHRLGRAVLGLAAVVVLLGGLMTWSRARDPSCGTVRTVNGSPVEVVPLAESVPCAEAIQVLRAYYERVSTQGQGSGGFLTVGRWQCISSLVRIEETGQVTTCTHGTLGIESLAL